MTKFCDSDLINEAMKGREMVVDDWQALDWEIHKLTCAIFYQDKLDMTLYYDECRALAMQTFFEMGANQ